MGGIWACIVFTFRPSPAPSPGAVSPIHHTIVRGHLDTNSLSLGIGSRILEIVIVVICFEVGGDLILAIVSLSACILVHLHFASNYNFLAFST